MKYYNHTGHNKQFIYNITVLLIKSRDENTGSGCVRVGGVYPERKLVICVQASSEKNLTSASSSLSSRSTTGSTSALAVLWEQIVYT